MILRRTPTLRGFLKVFGRPLAFFFAISFIVTIIYEEFHTEWLSMPSLPLSLIGGALTIFLAFRNNSAYERWWEARTLWGALVNTSRNFARQILDFIEPIDDKTDEINNFKRQIIYAQIAYVNALRLHLRNGDSFEDVKEFTDNEVFNQHKNKKNVPLALLQHISEQLKSAHRKEWIETFQYVNLDSNLTNLLNVQGACERIKNTPLPRQYDFFPRLFVNAHWFLLPIGLISTLGWFTPIVSTLIGFIFLSLDDIGREIEDPFEHAQNDIPMSALSRTIEINLREMLGEKELPPPIQPVDGLLL